MDRQPPRKSRWAACGHVGRDYLYAEACGGRGAEGHLVSRPIPHSAEGETSLRRVWTCRVRIWEPWRACGEPLARLWLRVPLAQPHRGGGEGPPAPEHLLPIRAQEVPGKCPCEVWGQEGGLAVPGAPAPSTHPDSNAIENLCRGAAHTMVSVYPVCPTLSWWGHPLPPGRPCGIRAGSRTKLRGMGSQRGCRCVMQVTLWLLRLPCV